MAYACGFFAPEVNSKHLLQREGGELRKGGREEGEKRKTAICVKFRSFFVLLRLLFRLQAGSAADKPPPSLSCSLDDSCVSERCDRREVRRETEISEIFSVAV